jgi:hypothetical protein
VKSGYRIGSGPRGFISISVADRIINNPSISPEWPIKNPLPFDWVAHSPSQASLEAIHLSHSRYANLLIVQRHSRQAVRVVSHVTVLMNFQIVEGAALWACSGSAPASLPVGGDTVVISFLSIFIYQSHRGMDRLGIPAVLRGNPSAPGSAEDCPRLPQPRVANGSED